MNSLKDKVIIVTGGTSGIGESCVKLFAEAEGKIIIAGRNHKKGIELETKLSALGFEVKYFHLDVSCEESVKTFAKEAYNWKKRIDALFNNAGVYPVTPDLSSDESSEIWDNVLDVNSKGLFLVIKYCIEYLKQTNGTILNNASVAGLNSYNAGVSYAYGASKAAIIKMSKMMAKAYGKDVRVNCICPGVIDTPIFFNRDFSRFDNVIPMKRVGTPEEVAKAAAFLLSDDAGYINGAVVTVDGGQSL